MLTKLLEESQQRQAYDNANLRPKLEQIESKYGLDKQQFNMLKLENDILKEHMQKLYESIDGLMKFKAEQAKQETQREVASNN